MIGDQWHLKNLNSALQYGTNHAILRCVPITRLTQGHPLLCQSTWHIWLPI